jgi:hypothetical protein
MKGGTRMTPRHAPKFVLRILFSFVFLSFFIIPVDSIPAGDALPDTGQTKCYNATGEIPCPAPGEPFYGQDGNYEGLRPEYEVSANGLVVTDLNTGLIWQRVDDGVQKTWAEASAYCEALALSGSSDWRLPSRHELVSIADYGRYTPAINPAFNCQSGSYWSNRTRDDDQTYAWLVNFTDGSTLTLGKGLYNYVRCVRSEF